MTDIVEIDDSWDAGVYQLAVTDPVLGGPDGPDNKAAKALANRSRYQRVRNVTPWAALFAYPAHAYVQYGGSTWKSLVSNTNVTPGTDATKWIRWGYTSAELDAYMAGFLPYGAPPACPNSGPITTDNKAKIYKSGLGEYWMWMGDVWRVVASLYGNSVTMPAQIAAQPSVYTVAVSTAMPRNGVVEISGQILITGSPTNKSGYVAAYLTKNGALIGRLGSEVTTDNNTWKGEFSGGKKNVTVLATDVLAMTVYLEAATGWWLDPYLTALEFNYKA